MTRIFTTCVILVATFAAVGLPETANARGKQRSLGMGRSMGRSSMPRGLSQGFRPTRRSVSVGQLQSNPNLVPRSRNLGTPIPRRNTSDVTLARQNRTQVNLRTPRLNSRSSAIARENSPRPNAGSGISRLIPGRQAPTGNSQLNPVPRNLTPIRPRPDLSNINRPINTPSLPRPVDGIRDRNLVPPVAGGRNNGSPGQLPTNNSGNRFIPSLPGEVPDQIRPVGDNNGNGNRPVSPVDPAAGLRDLRPIVPPNTGGITPVNPGDDGRTPPQPGDTRNPSPDAPVDTPNDGRNPSPDDTAPPAGPPVDTPVQEPPPPRIEEGGATGELVEVPAEEPPVESPADDTAVFDGETLINDLISQLTGSFGDGGSVTSDAGVDSSAVTESVESTVEAPAAEAVEPAADAEPEPAAEAAEAETVDVEITDVRLVDAGGLAQDVGPRYRIVCRNNGNVEVPKFHVAVLVDLGKQLTEKAELVTVESVGILPGKTQAVDVRLPVAVLKMVPKGSKAVPFEIFAAVVDSDERLTETDEENNVRILTRDTIQPIETAEKAESQTAEESKPAASGETFEAGAPMPTK